MIKNWLVRGDTHGRFKWLEELEDYKPAETAIIILGDAGLNFFLNYKDDLLKQYVNEQGYHIYCLRGNHEMRPQHLITSFLSYDEEVGGVVYREPKYNNIRYFTDYGSYVINGHTVAVIGGAYSVDKNYRLARAGITDPTKNNPIVSGWFEDEQLTPREMDKAEQLLVHNAVGDKIKYDFVLTHTCPKRFQPTDLFLNFVDQSGVDDTMEVWLDKMCNELDWNIWLFGHYHSDRMERPHVEMFFNDTDELENIYKRWERYDDTGELDWWLPKSPYFQDKA